MPKIMESYKYTLVYNFSTILLYFFKLANQCNYRNLK